MKHLNLALRLAFTLTILALSQPSFSYYESLDTGKLVAPGEYKLQSTLQPILSNIEGAEINFRFATGLYEESEMQVEAGVGTVDFHVGGFYKWVPYPDLEQQPAIGGKVGLAYARFSGSSVVSLMLSPMISKEFSSNVGTWVPFASIPLALDFSDSNTNVAARANLGVEWTTNRWDNIHFLFELGLNLSHSFNSISFGASYDFDGDGVGKIF